MDVTTLTARTAGLAILLTSVICFSADSKITRDILPIPDSPFKGKIGLRPSESKKDFPYEVKAPEGAPNILLILTDDVGFGATSTFGDFMHLCVA